MPIEIDFRGWFQVRLATDPDPHDEPRGVSGFTWAYPGEPDFDRIIRFQPEGAFARVACEPEIRVGVSVAEVRVDGTAVPGHPLDGATVDLGDRPVFEGRNGIVAEAGLEPILPFRIRFGDGTRRFGRAYATGYEFPYAELRGKGIDFSDEARDEVRQATGIADLGALWKERERRLEAVIESTDDEALAEACRCRIEFMRKDEYLVGDYDLRSRYAMDLTGPVEGLELVPELSDADADGAWPIRFWMGGWDFDSMCGYVTGTLATAQPTA
ncbi:hypothetical protein [Prauserella cavernicola]|uniref:Uncharacterized protein n=1 Tax=Prauserella cavernicola TaxID=2800127 RepID=A0A934V7N0_9PSEU|nr:hypothetical protein [Prauserella cavernicola]MBK1787869.1 hypothetical protein [Prauserella cavernicola]